MLKHQNADDSDDDFTYEFALGKGEQGDSGTCVRFAIANGLVRHAHKYYRMTLDVGEVAGSLINFFNTLDGLQPTEYSGKKVVVQTKEGSLGDEIAGTWCRFFLLIE